ncbi:MAG: DNA translocase FtsK [Solirubrobacterales bacterium]|nr:DNA translocase FtsK [Solirubrobacterales bacterium]
MAAARKRRKSTPRRRAKRSVLAGIARPRLTLEPHHVDVIGLALIAVGIFVAGVAYLHWSGGALGNGALTALRFAFGALGYAVPAALVAAGALLLLRELRPPKRPIRTGTICLVASLTLVLAAGTLGIGPGRTPDSAFWQARAFEARGGVLGQAELWLASHLLSTLGAHILAVFLAVAGMILLSGATLASVLRMTGEAGRTLKRSGEDLATVVRPPAARSLKSADRDAAEMLDGYPADPDTAELVVKATHVEAPGVEDDGELEVREEGQRADDQPPRERLDGEVNAEDKRDAPSREDAVDPAELTPQGRYRESITDDPQFEWKIPSSRSLTRSSGEAAKPDTAGQEQTAATLLETLAQFKIEAKLVGRVTGPHITRYELKLSPGTKMSKVSSLEDDLAYALAATDVRILAPIPGKQAVGVEVPNARRRIVHLGDVFQDPPAEWSPLTVWLGKDIAGRAIGADLVQMPHLLVGGTTGAGKSACVNAMLASILLRATPHEVRLVLVDPKQVELNHYESIPHLLTPVITNPRMAANALQNLVKEMEQRYAAMSIARARSLVEFNRARGKRGEAPMPYILCVIDELADLMMVAPAEVEDSIIRLAQKARAVGIHLVLATQSPRVQVITGLIKANVPSRIAFAVSSRTDSMVILDQNGAESLIGMGDMLFSPVGSSKLQRIQGAYIDEEQIFGLTDNWRRQGQPELHEELLEEVEGGADEGREDEGELHPDEDPLLEEAIALVAQMGTASTSMLQRRLRLGYTRAGRLIDMLERRGVISGYEGSKPRQVLITEADVPRIISNLAETERTAGVAGGATREDGQ